MTTTVEAPVSPAEDYADALAFEAPYVIEKLVKDHVAESVEHAELLFREIKRYFVITECDPDVTWSMYSLEIDAVWHQFVLFTRQYLDYCRTCFGCYIQHAPSNAPKVHLVTPRAPSTFQMFAERYEQIYGEPLPDVWFDDRNVTLARRILFDRSDALSLEEDHEDGMVKLLNGQGDSIFAVDTVARSALEFMIRTKHFFVRELPGDLDDAQRIALVSVLVENRILALAA
jgi:hypothetical protein